ncbi:MAG: 50S ribosomal protein L18 [Fibrobacterota bacterium]|nr:50S ribosomal protein L18 [Fibrobacterota bacterium]QQS06869.1 MAG: 50S ribosomal protein L18 [Fibrobacterota bacterium]
MSKIAAERFKSRIARHKRVRSKVSGTTERPRLAVRRSLKHIYAQIVDDTTGRSLAQVASTSEEVRAKTAEGTKTDVSKVVGELIAAKAKEKGISSVVFDRGGYLYHGRVQAVAEAARSAGLEF